MNAEATIARTLDAALVQEAIAATPPGGRP